MTLVQTSETSTSIINRDLVQKARPRYRYPYDLPHLGYTRRRGASSIVHSALGQLPPTGNPSGGRCDNSAVLGSGGCARPSARVPCIPYRCSGSRSRSRSSCRSVILRSPSRAERSRAPLRRSLTSAEYRRRRGRRRGDGGRGRGKGNQRRMCGPRGRRG